MTHEDFSKRNVRRRDRLDRCVLQRKSVSIRSLTRRSLGETVLTNTTESQTRGATARGTLGRALGFFTGLRPGEAIGVAVFFGYAFLLLVCYYILKTLREPLLLADGSAELKSYAYATIAMLLLLMVPLYSLAFRYAKNSQLIRWVTIFFIANLAILYLAGRVGVDIGFAYFVWVGIFSVTMLAQFWAFAADSYNVASGQRLFPVIMVGAACGGLVGPWLVGLLFPILGPWTLMLLALAILAATLPFADWIRTSVPETSAKRNGEIEPPEGTPWGGFAVVFRDRYLMMLALLAVLLNCVNTTGEYLLTECVIRYAENAVLNQPGADKGEIIASFYGHFFSTVNAISLFVQFFLVARLFRWIGVHRAVLILPVIAVIGYGLMVFVPIFSVIRAIKIVENSIDYSLMNTVRHALYLPLSTAQKYEGKTTIDTFFWRFGDVVQGGVVFAGLNWFGFGFEQFAALNMLLSLVWIGIAIKISKHYTARARGGAAGSEAAAAKTRAPIPHPIFSRLRPNAGRVSLVVLCGVIGSGLDSSSAMAADQAHLFSDYEPLTMEFTIDLPALCRKKDKDGCEDLPATLSYRSSTGEMQTIMTRVRARGNWRRKSKNCRVPPLFLFFDENETRGTIFESQPALPLTTHCQSRKRRYEQYLLKEYLGYRIYNLLSDASLRVRLVRMVYRNPRKPEKAIERYAFFTEHFESLARRSGTEVWRPKVFDPATADATQMTNATLFQYLIGNTDWSIPYQHNFLLLRSPIGTPTVVPYDLDFSGLVNAEYAGPPEGLRIRSVTQRLYRGYCRQETDWESVFANYTDTQGEIFALLDEIPDLSAADRGRAERFLQKFFAVLESPDKRRRKIIEDCRRLT